MNPTLRSPAELPPLPSDAELLLETPRLVLEPVTMHHLDELYALFRDPELHHFKEHQTPSYEKQRERCERWSRRKSPAGDEIWLNWAARLRSTGEVVGSFQAAVRDRAEGSVGYLVARSCQRQGIGAEAVSAVFGLLRETFGLKRVQASVYAENHPSIRLAKRVGMQEVLHFADVEVFPGVIPKIIEDELVFQIEFS